MYKAILIAYLGMFGQVNPQSDVAMIIPTRTMEQCQQAKTELLEKINKDKQLGMMYAVECLPANMLNLVTNQG